MAADLKDLAVSFWRMERWVNNANVERKMAATSALRTIKKYLDSNGIEVLDLTGNVYDPGMAVDVINNDAPGNADKDKVIISEMIKPVIIQNGTVIQFGQVSIGLTVKKAVENKVKTEENNSSGKDISNEIIELSNYIKAPQNNKWKIAGIAVGCAVIIFMITEAIVLFNVNNSIKYKIENKEVVSTVQVQEDNSNKKSEQVNNVESNESKQGEDEADKTGIKFKEYTVEPGDSLLAICEKNNIKYDDNIEYIKNINGLSDINKIYIGQKILIPMNIKEDK